LRASSFVLFTKHEEDWMDRACGTHGGKICVLDFCRKPNKMEDLNIDGKGIKFQWVLKEQDDKVWDDLSGSGHK